MAFIGNTGLKLTTFRYKFHLLKFVQFAVLNNTRPQISIENMLKIQKITGRSSYNFDASLSELLERYQKFEKFYNNSNGVKNEFQ